MENHYLSLKSEKALRGMNQSVFYTRLNNFVGKRGATLDECVIYVARNMLGLEVTEGFTSRVITKVKALYILDRRQPPHFFHELRKLIMRVSGE